MFLLPNIYSSFTHYVPFDISMLQSKPVENTESSGLFRFKVQVYSGISVSVALK